MFWEVASNPLIKPFSTFFKDSPPNSVVLVPLVNDVFFLRGFPPSHHLMLLIPNFLFEREPSDYLSEAFIFFYHGSCNRPAFLGTVEQEITPSEE